MGAVSLVCYSEGAVQISLEWYSEGAVPPTVTLLAIGGTAPPPYHSFRGCQNHRRYGALAVPLKQGFVSRIVQSLLRKFRLFRNFHPFAISCDF